MKTIVVLATVLMGVLAVPAEYYDLAYENFNIQEVVDNERLIKHYVYCFLDQGPCTADGDKFKKIIPEALRTNCGKCTSKQKGLIRTFVRGVQSKHPDLWDELCRKEDPSGEFKEIFDKFLNASD